MFKDIGNFLVTEFNTINYAVFNKREESELLGVQINYR